LPHQIEEEEINEYLVALARDPKSLSRSSFKHMVYGLRYYYRLLGINDKAIALPSLFFHRFKLILFFNLNNGLIFLGYYILHPDYSNKPHICPYCKQGKMIRLRQLPRIRSPPGHLPSILKSFFL